VKIEEGVCRGNVVYHSYVKKSKKEIKQQMDEVKRKRDLKQERKRVQDANVQRKQEAKEAKEQAREDKKKTRFADEDDNDSDEKEVDGETKAKAKKGAPKKAEEKFEDFGDVDFDESKDARAMPKKQPGLTVVKASAKSFGSVLGKRKPRGAAVRK